jgi:hypothetical protein
MEREGRKIAEAGLSDQIGKPFDVAAFYRMLARWIPASKQIVATAPEKQTPRPAAMVPGGGDLPARRGRVLQAAVSRFA